MTFRPDPKVIRAPKERTFKKKAYEPTNELTLFKKIFIERRGICQITKHKLEFNVGCFLHILSKGTRQDLRLNKNNILLVEFDFHYMYDNCGKEKTLLKYPQAEWVYDAKQKLKAIPVIKK